MGVFRHYLSVMKPGIILGNLLTTAAGFFIASQGAWDFTGLAITLCGVA